MRTLTHVVLAVCGAGCATPMLDTPSTAPSPPPLTTALWASNFVPGQQTDVVVEGADPYDTLALYGSVQGPGAGPCPPYFGSQCLDLLSPIALGRMVADDTGRAQLRVSVPSRLAAGEVFLQALGGGAANSYGTPVVQRQVQATPPTPVRLGLTDPPIEPYTLEGLDLEGDTLFVDVSYSGGCADHTFVAEWDGSFMESLPEQVAIDVFQYPSNDPCDAIIFETLRFDLRIVRYAASNTPILVNVGGEQIVFDFL